MIHNYIESLRQFWQLTKCASIRNIVDLLKYVAELPDLLITAVESVFASYGAGIQKHRHSILSLRVL